MNNKIVTIHYPFIAKYRVPIFSLLAKSKNYNYNFWASKKEIDKFLLTENKGLPILDTPLVEVKIPFINKMIEWQPRAITHMLQSNMDAYIVLANPNSISTWICVIIAKIKKIPVLMWSHGYLTNEQGIKGFIRKFFYHLANAHLLYGNKAKEIMIQKGFDTSSLHVIYNSLDYEKQKENRENLTYSDRLKIRRKYKIKEDAIVLIAIGRLMSKLKLDQAIKAIKLQEKKGIDTHLFIIGDGPEKNNLKALVEKFSLDGNIIFYGACHDENELAQLYNASDYSVVMGKVGLSAMHSLAYGIPMITNDNMDEHFPEIEAIIDKKTGYYFKNNNIEDFVSKLRPIKYRSEFYNNCIDEIEKYYTPKIQKKLIETAIAMTIR